MAIRHVPRARHAVSLPDSVASGTVTLPIHCALCGGAVTVQMTAWQPSQGLENAVPQPWVCPYCWQNNSGTFPGTLVWVTKQISWPPTSG
jgi:hypothetical protein